MSHFGFMCPPYLGHLNPMQALAGALVARGHTATFMGLTDAKGLVPDRRFSFAALGVTSHAPGTLAKMTAHMTDPRGLKLFKIMRDMAGTTDMLCREAPAAIHAYGIDAIVTDQLEPAGGLIAEHLGMPFVSVANALPINREPTVPPPFVGWRYDPSDHGAWRNRGGYRVSDIMMGRMSRVIERHATAWHLTPRRRIDQCLSPMAEITQIVPGFDFPRRALPATVEACGPLRAPHASTDLDGLLGDGRPLVFASMGTLQGGRASVFRTIANACHMLNLHLVIAHGGRLSAAECASCPGAPVIRDFVPQTALLRHATLAITNGGLNTVMDALAAGVPVIAIPVAFEQAAIGARLDYAGAGRSIPLRRLTVERLRATMVEILSSARFAEKARALSRDIDGAGGVDRAADLIERVVRGRASHVGDALPQMGFPAAPARMARA